MSSSELLQLTIEETISDLSGAVQTLITTLSQMQVDEKISEINVLVTTLNTKINEIIKMYNDVNELQGKVNIAKQVLKEFNN